MELLSVEKLKNNIRCYKCGKKIESKMIFVFVDKKYISDDGDNPCINCYREMLIQDMFKN